MKIRKIAAIALCAAILASAAAIGVSAEGSTGKVDSVELVENADSIVYTGVSEVAANCMPSIVSITNQSVQEVSSYYSMFGNNFGNRSYTSTSVGSGIIIGQNDTELLIATNNHVVEDDTTLTVTFVDEQSYEAQIKGTDSENDLAVISIPFSEISDDTLSQIKIAKVGNSDEVLVGEQVVAIGNALGYGQSVTTGIVSALNRTIEVSDSSSSSYYYGYDTTTYEDLIQIDAPINGGNSGGALLNLKGELIGINSAKATSSGVEGMGYAININKAMDIINNLMERETRTKVDESESGYLGISGATISSSYYNVPTGVYIDSVTEGGAADIAGITENDIITEFDGQKVSSIDELKEMLLYYKAGETVEVKAYVDNENYGYEEQTFEVTLGERPSSDTDTSESSEKKSSDEEEETEPSENGNNFYGFGGFGFGGNGSSDEGAAYRQ